MYLSTFRLSIIINNCQSLSIIVNNCQSFSLSIIVTHFQCQSLSIIINNCHSFSMSIIVNRYQSLSTNVIVTHFPLSFRWREVFWRFGDAEVGFPAVQVDARVHQDDDAPDGLHRQIPQALGQVLLRRQQHGAGIQHTLRHLRW